MTADITRKVLAPEDLGIGRLFERVRDAVVVADATNGRIVLWNPTAEAMFGYSADEALGMSVSALVPQPLKVRHSEGLARYRATGHGHIVDAGGVVEVPALRKSGDEIRVELSLNPIDQVRLEGTFVLAIIRDVTERTRLRLASERQLRDIESLYRADSVLHRSLRLDDVLQGLVDLATDIMRADKSAVLVWDADHERLVPGASRGFRPESLTAMSHGHGAGIGDYVVLTGQAIAVEDTTDDSFVMHDITDAEGIRSFMHVPVQVSGEVFGVFAVHYRDTHSFTNDEKRMLEALAQRAALAIENARLYERAQTAAVLEERQRLARELHDAVTQTLFAARRPAALTEAPLSELIQQLAQATAARGDLDVNVSAVGQHRVPHDVQLAVYRLAQEALNNVIKHAAAKRVDVELQVQAETVYLSVVDDGRGFDAQSIPAGHLGLGIMGERAAAIGAMLTVDSRPGAGTRVALHWSAASGVGAPSST